MMICVIKNFYVLLCPNLKRKKGTVKLKINN